MKGRTVGGCAHVVGLFVVTLASLDPNTRPPGGGYAPIQFDAVAHVAAYGFLAVTALLCLGARSRSLPYLGLLSLYGGMLEFFQAMIPGRSGSFDDLLANVIGVAVGAVLMVFVRRYVVLYRQ